MFVVEAKCWPSYLEGKLKKLNLKTLDKIRAKKYLKNLNNFLDENFINEYRFEGKKIDGKMLAWWDVDNLEIEKIKQQTGLTEIIPLKRVFKEDAEAFRRR